MEDDRPSAAHVDQEEAEEDALPDWTQFAKLAKGNADKNSSIHAVPFIPKRGEKDFEPLAASSAFPPSSKEATLSKHQQNTLQRSRNALYSALSSGSRHHSSRAHNSFTWRPELARATCDSGIATYGIHFGSIGHFNVERKQVELLPEEALYMNERGAIELWTETEEGARVPMSVQQAWSQLIGRDELTAERYQVYAFLKRLGYVLVRARSIPGTERPPPVRPFSLYYTIRDTLSIPLSYLRNLLVRIVEKVRTLRTNVLAARVRMAVTRSVGSREGRFASLVSGRRWSNYHDIFSRLQIIPTGHDRPLPRSTIPHNPSILTPLVPSPNPSHTLKPSSSTESTTGIVTTELKDLEKFPYQPFFHMYKPVTKYKKSAPPPPDFRIVVINGSTTPMPNLFEFTDMFNSVPFPSPSPPGLESRKPAPPRMNAKAGTTTTVGQRNSNTNGPSSGPPLARNNRKPTTTTTTSTSSPSSTATVSSPSSSSPDSLFKRLITLLEPYLKLILPQRFLSSLSSNPSNLGGLGKPLPIRPKKTSSPYPRLKTGRRTILVAIVNDGTSSILRFSESEFAKLPWNGTARSS